MEDQWRVDHIWQSQVRTVCSYGDDTLSSSKLKINYRLKEVQGLQTSRRLVKLPLFSEGGASITCLTTYHKHLVQQFKTLRNPWVVGNFPRLQGSYALRAVGGLLRPAPAGCHRIFFFVPPCAAPRNIKKSLLATAESFGYVCNLYIYNTMYLIYTAYTYI